MSEDHPGWLQAPDGSWHQQVQPVTMAPKQKPFGGLGCSGVFLVAVALLVAFMIVVTVFGGDSSEQADPPIAPETDLLGRPRDLTERPAGGPVTAVDIADALISAGVPITRVTDMDVASIFGGVEAVSKVIALVADDYEIRIAIWPTQESADADWALTIEVGLFVGAQCGTTVVYYMEYVADAAELAQWTAPIEAVLEDLVGPCQ